MWRALFATYGHAYLAALLIAVGCAVVGMYVVLRRVAFVGIATAQIAAAGVALAFLTHTAPLPAAIFATLIAVVLFALGKEPVRVSGDAVIGVAFAVASALSILFVFRSSAELDRIEHIIYGTLLFASRQQVVVLAIGVGIVLLLHALLGKEFLMVSFDPETSATLGLPTRRFNLLLFATIGTVIALSIGTAGSLLAFALLILPPMTGLLLAERIGLAFAISIATAALTAILGVLVSVLLDSPTSPAIVVTGAGLLLAAAIGRLRPIAGVVVLLGMLGLVGWMATHRDQATSEPTLTDGDHGHVDLELALHDRRVKRGDKLEVDYVVRIRGNVPGNLHLLVNVGSAIGETPLGTSRRAGRIEIDTVDLAPGVYTLSGSLWSGSPTQPDVDTEILPPDICPACEHTIEVTG